MPYVTEWVDPDKYLEYNDVCVYCTYKNDDAEINPARSYFFTTDINGKEEDDPYSFDVRDLEAWYERPKRKVEDSHIRDVICKAIDNGELKIPPMTDEEYIYSSGVLCPNCREGNVEGIGSMQVDDGVAWQSVKCTDCGAEWTDIYKLAGYDNFELPDGEVAEDLT